MPNPRENPLRFVPRSVSDTVEGDNSPAGACSSLMNLIWTPDTPNVLVCRPANTEQTAFPGFSTPGVVSVAFNLGNLIYGMIGSASPSGKDRPFIYNVVSNTFTTPSGVVSANCPTTQATTGDWTPPTMDTCGSRIVVTHPGFNFAGGYAFGYFDLSGFTETSAGDITSGSPTIKGNVPITGIGPGYTISGTGIPSSTTVVNTANVSITTTGTTNSTTTITAIPSTANMAVGQLITGSGIPSGATIASIVSSTSITISSAATASASGVSLYVTGTTITMSANATATTTGLSITIAGGTAATPLWAAGNTTGALQLASLPQAVRQFSNRFYFAAGNNLVFTDTLSLNVSNATVVQVLTIGDSTNITALSGLPLYTTTGGVLQALVVFKQYSIWQVTGDSALSTLALNQLAGTIGTSAPRSVQLVPQGIFFMASDGIRSIGLTGEVSEPDPDLAIPFIYALYPTRASACFNADIYKICVQNGYALNTPYQDYYYHLKNEGWTGPHSFRHDMAVAYQNDFIVFNTALPGTMWNAYSVQNQNDAGNTYIENGTQMTWNYETSPMTDTGNMYANAAVRCTLDFALQANGNTYVCQALDENNGVLAIASITAPLSEGIWDAFNWGDGTDWGAEQFGLEPLLIPWTQPLIFNKLVFQIGGNSAGGLKVGALYVGYERLRYLKQ